MSCCYAAKAGHKLLGSNNPPVSASHIAVAINVYYPISSEELKNQQSFAFLMGKCLATYYTKY
jgi:hypothetical protein